MNIALSGWYILMTTEIEVNTCYMNFLQRIKHECSCFFEFIRQVEENDKMRGLPSILSCFFDASLINSIIQDHDC